MRSLWYEELLAKLTPSSWRGRPPASRRKWPWQPRLEPLEARLVLYDHTWSHGTCILNCSEYWADEQNWSNGSPAGDPDPAGAVVIFPQDAGSGWDVNRDNIPGELPVTSLFYHRGGFETQIMNGSDSSLLLSQNIFTDLAGETRIEVPIRFTSDTDNFEHHIQVNNGGLLELEGNLTSGLSALLDKEGTGTLALFGNDQNSLGSIALQQGTLQLGAANALADGTPITAFAAGTVLDLNNFDATARFQANVLGNIRLGSATLSFSAGTMTDIRGMISGTGGLTIDGANAQVTLDGSGADYFGQTLVNAGNLRVDGYLPNSPVTVASGATLDGTGIVTATFAAGSSFQANIRGSNQSDELTVVNLGGADLAGATLDVKGAANSAEGDKFTILDAPNGIVAPFAGLPDGTIFTVDHKAFRVNYVHNQVGEDVVLTHLPQFVTPPTYTSVGVDAGGPHGLAVGDFNGDGVPDLVAVNNFAPASLSVLLSNGDGTFQSPSSVAVPAFPNAVTVGDFNGDGIPDLAVAAGPSYSGTVYVLLGNGDGTFQAPVSYAVGALPTDIEVADVNGDGSPDLVVLNQNDNGQHGSISILYGNGDGTFQPSTAPMTFSGYTTMSFATLLDPDSGRVDLAVGNDAGFADHDSVISLLVNQGNDTNGHALFQEVDYHTLSGINALAVADFNGDGKPDILWVSGGEVGAVLWGAFDKPPVFSSTGINPSTVAVGDFDGDGDLDIALPGGGGNPHLLVLYGRGDGSFGPPSTYDMTGGGGFTIGVVASDFNGDGAPDLAAYTSGRPASVGVLLNMGYGGSGPAPQHGNRAPGHGAAALDTSAATLAVLADPHAAANVPPTVSDLTVQDHLANHAADVPAAWMAPLALALDDSHTPPPVLDALFAIADPLNGDALVPVMDLERTEL